MKSVLIAVVFAFSSVASASTIAVTGTGRPGGYFSVIGNNFQADSGPFGLGTNFGYCALGAPCAISSTAGIGPTGPGTFAMFNGQPDLSSGLSSGVEGVLLVE